MRQFWIGLFSLAVIACETIVPIPPTAEVKVEGEKFIIVDQTGKEWDVTHARNRYGMDPEQFQFGLGPNAIHPIVDPIMICPGQSGYPPTDSDRIVIGVSMEGETKAYAINDLTSHEVVDDAFGDVYVAVGY